MNAEEKRLEEAPHPARIKAIESPPSVERNRTRPAGHMV